jgi:hypothetical protein
VRFNKVVTKATQLIGPHKTQYAAVHNSKLVIRAKTVLHAPGLALVRVMLLKTYGLWTFRNLLLDLLLIQNEPTNVASYTR